MNIKIDEIKIDENQKNDFHGKQNLLKDANESAFFLRELEYIKRISYDTKYKHLKAIELIPVSTEADPGAQLVTYSRYTKIGLAKIIGNYAEDAPRVDIYGTQVQTKVYRIGDQFGYDRDEIRASEMANKRLDIRRAESAKRASDEAINAIALTGDSTYNITGFIKYSGTSEYSVLADGTGTSKLWSTKTPEQIIRDLQGLLTAISDTTNGVEWANQVLLPIAKYNYIKNTKMSVASDVTILEFFKKNNPEVEVDWLVELKNAGTGGTIDVMMAYVKDPMHLTLEIPLPFVQLPPQQENYGFKILTETKTAGVIIYYPLSVAWGEGI